MKIIISPAKKMEICNDLFAENGTPRFLYRTKQIYERLRAMDEAALQQLLKANDAIVHENFLRYQVMNLERSHTPALLSYVGIQYQYMAPRLFSERQWEYVKDHLRILSGFYGILRPDDAVTPYRLEMQAKLSVDGAKDLYGFWGRMLYDSLIEEEEGSPVILNLASKEYSKVIEPWITPDVRYITCVFGQQKDGKIRVKATEAKMARGEMVRFLAETEARDVEMAKEFSALDFSYSEEHSDKDTFVFLK